MHKGRKSVSVGSVCVLGEPWLELLAKRFLRKDQYIVRFSWISLAISIRGIRHKTSGNRLPNAAMTQSSSHMGARVCCCRSRLILPFMSVDTRSSGVIFSVPHSRTSFRPLASLVVNLTFRSQPFTRSTISELRAHLSEVSFHKSFLDISLS